MNPQTCLFCNRLEKNCKPENGKYLICSQCVQLMLSTDQAELMRAYNKATEKGYQDKARAIESFLIPEDTNARETKKPKRGTIRKKPMRVVGPSSNQLRAQQATI